MKWRTTRDDIASTADTQNAYYGKSKAENTQGGRKQVAALAQSRDC